VDGEKRSLPMKVEFGLDFSSISAADDVRLRWRASSGSRRARDAK